MQETASLALSELGLYAKPHDGNLVSEKTHK